MTSSGLESPPVALTIAGSDCSAGAGLQADLKTFGALGVYGLTVVAAVVAESPRTVGAVQAMEPGLAGLQFDLLLRSFPVAAIKTGLLGSAAIIAELRPRLAAFPGPIVIDPVAVASSGHSLVAPGYPEALKLLITECATLVTPNRAEAEMLLGSRVADAGAAPEAARQLATALGCAVLLKGGHFDGPEACDWLAHDGLLSAVSRPRMAGATGLHGTGCTYAAAITARLAAGDPLEEAIEKARDYLHRAAAYAYGWNTTGGSVTKALAHDAGRVQL